MRKWVLIFLLLVNVIVFFGFAMRSQNASLRSSVEVEQAFELRLVSEVSQESLVKIADQKSQGDIQPWFVEGACIFYEGIKEQKTADEIAGFMTEQGLSPLILMQTMVEKKYYLIAAVPKQPEARLALEVQLKAKNIPVTVVSDNEKAVYQVGAYASVEEVDKVRRALGSSFTGFVALKVQESLDIQSDYFIQLQDDIDRNLINKINDVLKLTYETIKIEKKVCKGVASTKPHQ